MARASGASRVCPMVPRMSYSRRIVASKRWASLLLIWSSRWSSAAGASAHIVWQKCLHGAAQIGPFQGQGEIGLEPPGLVAAVEAAAVESQAVERVATDHARHPVGKLNFAAGAPFLAREMLEHLGQQDIASD